jgi:hypothetical protein
MVFDFFAPQHDVPIPQQIVNPGRNQRPD